MVGVGLLPSGGGGEFVGDGLNPGNGKESVGRTGLVQRIGASPNGG